MIGFSGANASTVTFDNVKAPEFFEQVTSGGVDGPTFVTPDITFTGGVVLNDTPYPFATSGSNYYSTAVPDQQFGPQNNNEIDNGTTPLPGITTGTLTTPGAFNTISLDVINDMALPGTVTVTAFNSSNVALDSVVNNFVGFFNDPTMSGNVDHVTLFGNGISYFTVTPTSNQDQATSVTIDTVNLNNTPEPSSWIALVIGAGLLTFLGLSKRKQTAS
jgi:hypothetical protein